MLIFSIYSLWSNNPKTVTLVNIVDPDEMPHNFAFHQGLHCLQRKKFQKEIQYYLEIIKCSPSFCPMDHPDLTIFLWKIPLFYKGLRYIVRKMTKMGMGTIKYNNWPRIPHGKVTKKNTSQTRAKWAAFPCRGPRGSNEQTWKHDKHKT